LRVCESQGHEKFLIESTDNIQRSSKIVPRMVMLKLCLTTYLKTATTDLQQHPKLATVRTPGEIKTLCQRKNHNQLLRNAKVSLEGIAAKTKNNTAMQETQTMANHVPKSTKARKQAVEKPSLIIMIDQTNLADNLPTTPNLPYSNP